MEPGRVVEYMEDRMFKVAVCLQDRGNRIQALNEASREVNLGVARILHVDDRPLNLKEPRHRVQEQIRAVAAKRKELQESIDVKEVWELVEGEDSSFDPAFLADLVFGEASSPDHEAAFVRAVIRDRIHFKYKANRAYPQTLEKVTLLLEQREIEARREEELTSESAWLKNALAGGRVPEDIAERSALIEALKETALGDSTSPLFRRGEALLKRAEVGGADKAFDVLVKLGIWTPDQNLDLDRYQISIAFSEEVQEQTRSLVAQGPGSPVGRVDATDLMTLTIDSMATSDFDDALSLEKTDSGFRLGIHITDVSAYIAPDTPLDESARERATSIYMPDERIAMLPAEISDRLCSLREGEEKLALSLMVDLDSGLQIAGYRFVPSVIRVKRRLTYSEVNLLHDRDEDIHVLARIAQHLMQQRLDAGAIPQPPFEIALSLEPDGNVSIKKIERDGVSRIIVSESMILANRLAAEFLSSSGVPAFFRAQAPPKEHIEGDLSNDLFCIFRQRRQLQPLNLQTRVAAHSCLGVPAYTNMTSPLRRYMDLVAQRQIISTVSGETPVYNEDQLRGMLVELEPAVKRANLIKNRRHRYWMLKYFKKLQGQTVQALVLERHARSHRVVLTDALLECNLPFLPSVQLQPGEYIQVRIDRSNPRDDGFKISLS